MLKPTLCALMFSEKEYIDLMLSPNDSPGFLLWQAHNRWQRELKKVLKPLQLTHAQFALLAAVGHLKPLRRRVTQASVAEYLDADAMMVSTLCRDLESRALIQRERGQRDSREIVLTLTQEGRQLLKKSSGLVEKFDQSFYADQAEPLMDALRAVDFRNATE